MPACLFDVSYMFIKSLAKALRVKILYLHDTIMFIIQGGPEIYF